MSEDVLTGATIEYDNAPLELRTAIQNVMLDRVKWMQQVGISFKGMRDLYEVLGYDRQITIDQYRQRYQRGGIAKRIVEALPKATWRGGFDLVEDENPDNVTEFERAWDAIEQRLHISSTLQRADILTGLSTYAVVLIGARGDLNTPLPKISGGNPDRVLYLTPFLGGGEARNARMSTIAGSGADASIEELEDDPGSERFGLPRTYKLKRLDISNPLFQKPVHWTRIIHLADGILDNEVYGTPVLQSVWNLLDDLDKVTGGGAEAFWLRANQGIQLDVAKDMNLSADEKKALADQADEYANQMRRILRTRGVSVNTLGSDVANFAQPADSILTQIAGTLSIPKRILTGSELGELASSQDRENWRDQVSGRQTGYITPYVIRPLVDRLIEFGYLPKPAQYEVVWPQMETLTTQEKADGATKWASANSSAGAPIFTMDEIRDFWFGLAPLTDEQIKKELELKKQIVEATTPPELQEANADNAPGGPRPVPIRQPARDDADDDEDEDDGTSARAAVMSDDALDRELAGVLSEAIASGNYAVVQRVLGSPNLPDLNVVDVPDAYATMYAGRGLTDIESDNIQRAYLLLSQLCADLDGEAEVYGFR